MIESDPLGAIALWLLGVVALGFYLWQSYKLHAALADDDHPDHEVAKEAWLETDWDWWRRP